MLPCSGRMPALRCSRIVQLQHLPQIVWQGDPEPKDPDMTDHFDIDYRKLEAEVRALRAAELRRIGQGFGAWLRRVLQRRPAIRTA